MKITGPRGKQIEVTDLKLAIAQADSFRHYSHQDLAHTRQDDGLQAYWQDFYEKLLLLQSGPENSG